MKAFLCACVAVVAIAAIAWAVLDQVQLTTGASYADSRSVRLD